MQIKQEVLNRCITHEQHMQEVLKDVEYLREYLRLNAEECAQTGDCTTFFKNLERVVRLSNV